MKIEMKESFYTKNAIDRFKERFGFLDFVKVEFPKQKEIGAFKGFANHNGKKITVEQMVIRKKSHCEFPVKITIDGEPITVSAFIEMYDQEINNPYHQLYNSLSEHNKVSLPCCVP